MQGYERVEEGLIAGRINLFATVSSTAGVQINICRGFSPTVFKVSARPVQSVYLQQRRASVKLRLLANPELGESRQPTGLFVARSKSQFRFL